MAGPVQLLPPRTALAPELSPRAQREPRTGRAGAAPAAAPAAAPGGDAAAAPRAAAGREAAAVRKAARGIEAYLVREMLASMERAQLEEGLFGKGAGSGPMKTAFELLLSETIAEGEPLGIAEGIARQLTAEATRPRADGAPQGPTGAELLEGALRSGISFEDVPIFSGEDSSSADGDR